MRGRRQFIRWQTIGGLIVTVCSLTLGSPRVRGVEAGAVAEDSKTKVLWSLAPVTRVAPPSGGGHPVDRFLDRAGGNVRRAEAQRSVLLRRVTFDLTGLLPTREELKAFLEDESPGAYERVVDRLLASPAFGERWAQHWLDLVAYADSNGFELDADRPDAWRYRDWVVRALNEDMPYDEFVTLQVAGDEARAGDVEAWVASGFGRAGPREVVAGNIDPEVRRQNELTSATGVVGTAILGLTVGCARCHDHKFDPLTMVDYYRLEAYFAGVQLEDKPIYTATEQAAHDAQVARVKKRMAPLEQEKAKLEEPYRTKLRKAKEAALTEEERRVRSIPKEKRTPEEERLYEGTSVALRVTWEEIAEAVAEHGVDQARREELKRRLHELELELPAPLPHVMAMREVSHQVPPTHVLRRGNVKSKTRVVEPSPPDALVAAVAGSEAWAMPPVRLDGERSGRRKRLAEWLVSDRNPLTARVVVNRLWQHYFGAGLVATPSNFGVRGERPAAPELLDWLASELVSRGWRLKAMHRLLATSAAYRQESEGDGSGRVGLMTRKRLEAEALRDAMLQAAGVLQLHRGGPGVRIGMEPEVQELIFTEAEVVDLWPEHPDPGEHHRRSIYVHRKRNVRYPMFEAFDAPDAQTFCAERARSIHAPQALVLFNGSFAQGAARAMARSLISESSRVSDRVREAFWRCYSRGPTDDEMREALAFVGAGEGNEMERWTDFSLALLNSNEFIHIP